MQKRGYKPLGPKKRVGHGVGLSQAEAPSLGLADDTVLRPGMVLTPEPRFDLPTGERVHIEEVVVVTETGCEQITRHAAASNTTLRCRPAFVSASSEPPVSAKSSAPT